MDPFEVVTATALREQSRRRELERKVAELEKEIEKLQRNEKGYRTALLDLRHSIEAITTTPLYAAAVSLLSGQLLRMQQVITSVLGEK